jgi:hypothetical protein
MPAKAGIQNYLKTLDTRLRGYDVYGIYLILIALLSFPRRACPSEVRGGNPVNGKSDLLRNHQYSEFVHALSPSIDQTKERAYEKS